MASPALAAMDAQLVALRLQRDVAAETVRRIDAGEWSSEDDEDDDVHVLVGGAWEEWTGWEDWEDWDVWAWRAAPWRPSRPRRSASDRRAQARRAQGRAAQQLMQAFGELAVHRGCAPSRLGAALAEALAATGRVSSRTAPEAEAGRGTGHWRSRSGWQEALVESEGKSESVLTDVETAALVPTDLPTEPAQAVAAQRRPKKRKTALAAAKPSEGGTASLGQPAVEAARATASERAPAEEKAGTANSSVVGDAARRAAVVADVKAALAKRARGSEPSTSSASVAPDVGDGGAPAARGVDRQATDDASDQSRRARAFGFGRGRK